MKIEIPNPVALHATLQRTYNAEGQVYAVLYFGTTEITRWDVTDRLSEFESYYYDSEGQDEEDRQWLSGFVAAKLAPLFAGIR